jgi:hypothetical protein
MATSPGPEHPTEAGSEAQDQDWSAEVAGRIESTVALVRDKTTVPATLVARGVVFGVVAGVLGAAALFLVVVALIRLLDLYLPFHPVGRRVWVVDGAAAAIFLLSGAFLWRKRRPKDA